MSVDAVALIRSFAERSNDQGIVALAVQLGSGNRDVDAEAVVAEAVTRLADKNKKIQSGSIKLLYEIGYRSPEMIAGHAETFLRLLKSRNNRLVWGGMIALSTITRDRGTLALGLVAAADPAYREELVPRLLSLLKGCDPKEAAMFAEHLRPAIDESTSKAYRRALESRMDELSPPSRRRAERLFKKLPR
jgi:hypothetical protein